MTYTMDIETDAGVKQHPYHLGTVFEVAEKFVLARLADPEVISIALRWGHDRKMYRIYDFRDLFPAENDTHHEDGGTNGTPLPGGTY